MAAFPLVAFYQLTFRFLPNLNSKHVKPFNGWPMAYGALNVSKQSTHDSAALTTDDRYGEEGSFVIAH